MSEAICCSFCGRNQEEDRRLVAGQEKGVFICYDCVDLCGELVKEESDKAEDVGKEDKKGGKQPNSGGLSVTEADFAAYFHQVGEVNTDNTIEFSAKRCKDLKIKHVVVATSTGETAIKVAVGLKDQDVKVIAVTLHAGLWEKYVPPDPDKVKAAEEMGVTFLTCTHALMGNVGNAIMEKFGGVSMTDLIAYAYYTFSQGTKVAVEISVAAADAGLIPVDQEVISIAGSDTGADTALVLKPAYSTDFFSLRVKELIAKPR